MKDYRILNQLNLTNMKQFKFIYTNGDSEYIYAPSLEDIFGTLFNDLVVTKQRAMLALGIDTIEYE